MVVSYETPIGFHHYASDFAEWAARAHAHKTKFYSPVPYYLYCRALELTLKAFLLANGVTKSQLKKRKLGHDLLALLERATNLGVETVLEIKPLWRSQLLIANDFYTNKEFEYFSVGSALRLNELPSLVVLQEFSTELLKATKPVCIRAADRSSV